MKDRRAAETDEATVDLTPMLDIVFIMLIFFIVTATFVKEAGIQVLRPEATTNTAPKSINMVIALTANDEVWMDGGRVDPRGVRTLVERLRAENPKGTVVIQADQESEAGLLVDVIDQVRQAGAPYIIAAGDV